MDIEQLLNSEMLSAVNISLSSVFISLFATALSGFVLRQLYVRYGRSMNNREYFGNIFILLGITTCSVIIIVKSSLALSLGLVGALSIVRFRAAIKEPEELVFLFLVIAFGLAFGANQFAVGFVLLATAIVIVIVTAKYFSKNNGLDHSGLLVIISGDRATIDELLENKLNELMSNTSWAVIREIDYEGNRARIVFKCATSDKANLFAEELRIITTTNNLDYNLISDVNVPS
jgi:lipoprotein signal peptidase